MNDVVLILTCQICGESSLKATTFEAIKDNSASYVFGENGFKKLQAPSVWACAACRKKYDDLINAHKIQLANFGKGGINND